MIVPGAGGVAGGYKSTAKAVVVLAYRLVDQESSEVLAAGEARGESKRESKGGFAGMFVGGFNDRMTEKNLERYAMSMAT